MVRILKTIDAHVAGEPLRLVVEGLPRAAGRTMAQKRDSMQRSADQLLRPLVLEPRGHRDMCAALLTEPVAAGSDAGIVFLQGNDYAPLSGHGIIAVTTIAIERGLLHPASAVDQSRGADRSEAVVVFDTSAGSVQARARVQRRGDQKRVDSVAFTNMPAFVLSGGHSVRIGARDLRVDIAFGGAFYAIVDTEAIGIPLTGARLPELRRMGLDMVESINAAARIAHPLDPEMSGVAGVIFTGPPHDPEAHLRNVTIFGNGAADRSPCATGTSAVMAVLDAMGLIQDDQWFVHESLIGTLHRGRVVRRTEVSDFPAITSEIEGTAWITGEHTFCLDDDDPLKDGFLL